jgi:hypothetical protein
MESDDARRKEADSYSFAGLDGDHGDHELRMRRLAYAQVQATVYLGDQMGRIADALGDMSEEAKTAASALIGIDQGIGAR